MNQEDVAGKILIDLIERGFVEEKNEVEVHTYLLQAYAAGHDAGVRSRKRKAVTQYTMEGEVVEIHLDIYEAAKKVRRGVKSIQKAIREASAHCAGFRWAYVDEKDPNASEETVGSALSELAQQGLRTHASKKNSA